jgi:aldose 1-epimerase
VIDWPEFGTRLAMTADTPLRFLTVYVPDAETAADEAVAGITPYFCAEPVSNITDAANLPTVDHGLITLAPNAKISARVRFQPAVL